MQKKPSIQAGSYLAVLLLCFYLLLNSFPARGQQHLFDHFTTASGLPSNMAYRCTRDAEGFVWIATSGGVARFDGQSFETFSEADGLPDNDIINLYADRKNRIWFFGFNGRTSFYANGRVHTTATDQWLQPLQTDAFVLYIAEGEKHDLFFAYNNNNIARVTERDTVQILPVKGNLFFANKKLRYFPGAFEYAPGKVLRGIYDNDSLPVPPFFLHGHIERSSFEPSATGNLVYQRPNKVFMLTNAGFTEQLLCIVTAGVSRLRMLNDTSIAILTQGYGMFFYSLRQKKLTQHLLNGETITDVFMNGNGDIWCTSLNNGLFCLPASRARAQYITADDNLLHNEKCTAVYAGPDNEVWVGMDNAQVQVFRNGRLARTISLAGRQTSFGRVGSIAALRNGTMCIASDVGLFVTRSNDDLRKVYYTDPYTGSQFPLTGIKSCSIPPIGKVLLTMSNYVLQTDKGMLQEQQPLASMVAVLPDRVLSVFEDSRKNIWMGTVKGLVRIHGTDTALLYDRDPLLTRRILQIGETGSGYIVLATDGAGLVVLDRDKVCMHITARNGLVNNSCRKMRIAGDSVLVATASGIGIAYYHPGAGIFLRAVTEKDGLLSADCRDVALYGGRIYVATDKGISILSLHDVFSPGSKPVTYLKKILADGRPVMVSSGYARLKYGVRSLMINYGAVSQHATGGVEYRYRTAPDAAWITTDAPSFVYNDPQPQDMEVTVQARYKGGAWDKGKKLTICIAPLFYQQAWFICFFIVFLLTAAGAAMIFYYRRQRQRLYNQNRLVKLESQASQAMMNPHFVFNALNSVQHFLNDNDNYAANQYLTRFSRLIRRHLELNRRQYISLEEEFDFLRLYLEIEKSRCDGRLAFSMLVQPGIEPDELFLPVLIVQPLVENAVWHGINPKEGGGMIQITASIKNGTQLEIKIADDGVGLQHPHSADHHESIGTVIIRDRLQLLEKLYGKEFSVGYIAGGKGVTVIVHFPLLKKEDLLPVF
jgi:ligand-binding sensor domain-containing protein/two-component sensor histidine kinase